MSALWYILRDTQITNRIRIRSWFLMDFDWRFSKSKLVDFRYWLPIYSFSSLCLFLRFCFCICLCMCAYLNKHTQTYLHIHTFTYINIWTQAYIHKHNNVMAVTEKKSSGIVGLKFWCHRSQSITVLSQMYDWQVDIYWPSGKCILFRNVMYVLYFRRLFLDLVIYIMYVWPSRILKVSIYNIYLDSSISRI